MSPARTHFRVQEHAINISLRPMHEVQVDVLTAERRERFVERSLDVGVLPVPTERMSASIREEQEVGGRTALW
jgi:hypothetical protein